MVSSYMRFLGHTQRRTTFGRTPLDDWSARRRDIHLIAHNTHKRQTYVHAPGGIRTLSPSQLAPADRRLRLRGHWDKLLSKLRQSEGNGLYRTTFLAKHELPVITVPCNRQTSKLLFSVFNQYLNT
jgi:hypothetical protein